MPFVTAGDPSLDATVPVMHALVDAGADLIELGVPFSDPMADGPVIQHASERALARGVGLGRRARLGARVPHARRGDAGRADGLPQSGRDPRHRALRARGARGRRRRRAAGRLPAGGNPNPRPRSRASRPGADPARRADHGATRAWRRSAPRREGFLYYVSLRRHHRRRPAQHGRRACTRRGDQARRRRRRSRSASACATRASAAAIGAVRRCGRDRQRAGRAPGAKHAMPPTRPRARADFLAPIRAALDARAASHVA